MDTAARQHRDPVIAEEPRGALGGVACILILGREQDERPLELLVQRCEQQGERRLGDPRRRGKSLCECAQTVALA